jgi:hypothetical protein
MDEWTRTFEIEASTLDEATLWAEARAFSICGILTSVQLIEGVNNGN